MKKKPLFAAVGLVAIMGFLFLTSGSLKLFSRHKGQTVNAWLKLYRSCLLQEGSPVVAEFRVLSPLVTTYVAADLAGERSIGGKLFLSAYPSLPAWLRRRVAPPSLTLTQRQQAARMLHFMGPSARQALPALIRALTDRDPVVRQEAATALGAMGELARESAPALIPLLRDSQTSVRRAAVEALGVIDGNASLVQPALIKATGDKNPDVAAFARTALTQLDSFDPLHLPWLMETLPTVPPHQRWFVANPIGKLGAAAGPAVPLLMTLLQAKAEPPDPEGYTKAPLIYAARQIGPVARVATPYAEQLLASTNLAVRAVATMALWQWEGKTNLAVTASLALLQEQASSPGYAQAVPINNLAELGAGAAEAAPALRALLTNAPAYIQISAMRALWKIEGAEVEAVGFCRRILRDGDSNGRAAAARLAGEIGTAAKPALPDLLASIKAGGELAARSAVKAIAKIDPPSLAKIGRE